MVPKSLSYGNTATSFLGPGSAELLPNTTYYYVFDFTLAGGAPSAPAGSLGTSILSLGNVTY